MAAPRFNTSLSCHDADESEGLEGRSSLISQLNHICTNEENSFSIDGRVYMKMPQTNLPGLHCNHQFMPFQVCSSQAQYPNYEHERRSTSVFLHKLALPYMEHTCRQGNNNQSSAIHLGVKGPWTSLKMYSGILKAVLRPPHNRAPTV